MTMIYRHHHKQGKARKNLLSQVVPTQTLPFSFNDIHDSSFHIGFANAKA